jgi:hypothetical protein
MYHVVVAVGSSVVVNRPGWRRARPSGLGSSGPPRDSTVGPQTLEAWEEAAEQLQRLA